MTARLIRLPDIMRLTSLSARTLRRMIDAGQFPAQVYLTPSTPAWREDEVNAWIEALPRKDVAL